MSMRYAVYSSLIWKRAGLILKNRANCGGLHSESMPIRGFPLSEVSSITSASLEMNLTLTVLGSLRILSASEQGPNLSVGLLSYSGSYRTFERASLISGLAYFSRLFLKTIPMAICIIFFLMSEATN